MHRDPIPHPGRGRLLRSHAGSPDCGCRHHSRVHRALLSARSPRSCRTVGPCVDVHASIELRDSPRGLAVCAALSSRGSGREVDRRLEGRLAHPSTPNISAGLSAAASELGLRLDVRSFPADGFATTLPTPWHATSRLTSSSRQPRHHRRHHDAARCTRALRRIRREAEPAARHRRFAEVSSGRSALDALLRFSPNHDAGAGWRWAFRLTAASVALDDGLNAVVGRVARPPWRVTSPRSMGCRSRAPRHEPRDDHPATVGVRVCAVWGTSGWPSCSWTGMFGATPHRPQRELLLVCAGTTPVAVARRCPRPGVDRAVRRHSSSPLVPGDAIRVLPPAAVLLAPSDGRYPGPPGHERFGTFRWLPSPSSSVVAEIVEFAYGDDARLLLPPPTPSDAPRHVSAGELWTTGGDWQWRVWSMTQSGEVAFSEARSFVH